MQRRKFNHKPEKLGGKLLTLPGLYVKPYEALQQYQDRTIADKMQSAWQDEGMPIPDFEKMDKIERLEALSEWRGKYLEHQKTLEEANQKAKEDYEENQIQSRIKAQVSEQLSKQQQSATAQ